MLASRSPCAPSCSGRGEAQACPRPSRVNGGRRSVATHISANASSQLSVATQERRSPAVTWSTEAMEDDAFLATPASMSTSKPLRINLDLRLYRARLARMQAALSTDVEAKRALLKDAEASLRVCLGMDSSDPRSYVVLGKLLVQQKRYDEARKLYADGTTATGNTSPYIWAAWGYMESITGNVSRARKLFDAAIVVDETHAAAWHKWGMLEMRQGNYLRARDLWTSGITKCRQTISRSVPYLYCSLAVMAAELGKLSEARAWFQEGTRRTEGRASCALWHAWAMTEATLGDGSAVRYLFKRSLQANPRSRYAHLAWSMWERAQGNSGACLQLLARGSSLNPADPALYQARGIVEKEAGRFDAARAVFQQGLRVDKAHLYLWQAWGVMEFQLGRFDEARRLFQEGVWADPGSKDVVFIFQAWGVLEQRAGNAPLARELFKAALKVEPKNEATWATWIQMEEDLGRLEAANELRIRRSEQQWEFVIPASFSTRPEGGSEPGGPGGSGASLLSSLLGTLNRFFSARGAAGAASSSGSAGDGGGAGSSSRAAAKQLVRELLPADFRADLTLEEIITEASALEFSSGRALPASSSLNGTSGAGRAATAAAPVGAGAGSSGGGGGGGEGAAAAAAAAAAATAGSPAGVGEHAGEASSSGAGEDSSSSSSPQSSSPMSSQDASGPGSGQSRALFKRERLQGQVDAELGLQQRPRRPPPPQRSQGW